MQTQARMTARTGPVVAGGSGAFGLVAAIYIGLHLMWWVLPLFIEGDEVPIAAKVVTGITLGMGIIALAGLWAARRWGWWALTVLTVLHVVFAIPEVVGLEGVMRVGSIVSLGLLAVILVLLFRPPLRQVRG